MLHRAPLVLDLYYLLTPFGGSEARRQERLGEGTELDEPKELVLVRSPSGYFSFFGKVRDRALGTAASGLAAGSYTLELSAPSYQPRRVKVVLADTPPPFEALPDTAGA